MPSADTADHRAAPDDLLREALSRRDALALAEACSRTLGAAHGVTRRLVPRADVESVLRLVYADLWAEPPPGVPLERWVRGRSFDAAASLLRARGIPPAAPSAHLLLRDLPAPTPGFLDGTEQALATLDEEALTALLQAHDRGVAGGRAATRGLLALAEAHVEVAGDGADWVLGLLPAGEAAQAARALGGSGSEAVRTLRRGRRRLEGLPPAPDLAARVVAATLAGLAPAGGLAPVAGPPSGAPRTHLAAAPGPDVAHDGDGWHDATVAPARDTAEGTGDLAEDGFHPDDHDGHLAEDGFHPDDHDGHLAEDGFYPDGAGGRGAAAFADRWEDEEIEDVPPRGGRLLWVLGWLLAIVAAVGAGMLIGRLLLGFGILP